MTRIGRIKEIITGVVKIVLAALLLFSPEDNYQLILLFLAVYLTVSGIAALIYYFQMARFMVGGRTVLYLGIIRLDFGMLTSTLTDVPHYYILIYLILIHGFTGLIEILHVLESISYGSKSWKLKFTHGVLDILTAGACIFFMRNQKAAVMIYAAGLIYSAVLTIISACRSSKFIYIQ